MNKLSLTDEQKKKLLEICEDLFPECKEIRFFGDYQDYVLFNFISGKSLDVYWLELCMFELPKRIAENGKSVLPESTQYRIYESMSKRILNIHPTYSKVEPKHPVDYLYEEFKKI